jgi:hypothetical protein
MARTTITRPEGLPASREPLADGPKEETDLGDSNNQRAECFTEASLCDMNTRLDNYFSRFKKMTGKSIREQPLQQPSVGGRALKLTKLGVAEEVRTWHYRGYAKAHFGHILGTFWAHGPEGRQISRG